MPSYQGWFPVLISFESMFDVCILYRKGEMIKRVKESEIVATIVEEVEKFQPKN